jgi:hypothetical protein
VIFFKWAKTLRIGALNGGKGTNLNGLGSIDISPQPNESRNEADKAHVIASEFFKS